MMFRLPDMAGLSKDMIITQMTTPDSIPYLAICEYCRVSHVLVELNGRAGEPLYCMSCARTSPQRAFQRNLERTDLLISLSSKMRTADNEAKSILLEQSVVTIITSFEVFLRDIYSLILDHKHVVFGESIYQRIYDSTRNEFLNLGAANARFKKEVGVNLKEELGQANYSFLSSMYSARHIIVHNCSIKDKDYLNQTGDDFQNLNKKLDVTTEDVHQLTILVKQVAKLSEDKLREHLLDTYSKRIDLIISFLADTGAHFPVSYGGTAGNEDE